MYELLTLDIKSKIPFPLNIGRDSQMNIFVIAKHDLLCVPLKCSTEEQIPAMFNELLDSSFRFLLSYYSVWIRNGQV